MRYRIAAVGRLRRGFVRTGCQHYLERLRRLTEAEVVEVRDAKEPDAEAARRREARALAAVLDGRVVALDERGDAHRTAALAARIGALETRGTSRITLLIGGAEGLDPDLRARADERWRLSDFTLPHELARLVLLEQLYRIEALRAGHPYHRE